VNIYDTSLDHLVILGMRYVDKLHAILQMPKRLGGSPIHPETPHERANRLESSAAYGGKPVPVRRKPKKTTPLTGHTQKNSQTKIHQLRT